MRLDAWQAARWLAALVLAWILATALLSPVADRGSSLLIALVLATSAWQPRAGLFAVALVAPIGRVLTDRLSMSVRLSDAIVLAFLAGWLVRPREVRGGPRLPRTAALLASLFAAAVAVSAVTRMMQDYWLTVSDPSLRDSVTVLEGMALTLASIELVRQKPILTVRLPAALAVSTAVANVAACVPGPFVSTRIGVASASSAAMMLFVAAGFAAREHRVRRALWLFAAVATIPPLWTAVSRFAERPAAESSVMRIAAATGAVGGALFLAFLAAVIWRVLQGVALAPDDHRLAGCAAGVVVFVVAAGAAADPLRSADVAVPFWLILGVASALAGSVLLRVEERRQGVQIMSGA
jgi:hypothetical protein